VGVQVPLRAPKNQQLKPRPFKTRTIHLARRRECGN